MIWPQLTINDGKVRLQLHFMFTYGVPLLICTCKFVGDVCFHDSTIHSSYEHEIPNTLEAEFLHLVIGFWQWSAFPNLPPLQ